MSTNNPPTTPDKTQVIEILRIMRRTSSEEGQYEEEDDLEMQEATQAIQSLISDITTEAVNDALANQATPTVSGKQVDTLSVFKKDKNVQKFMRKYRYQYHFTMLPDLAELVRNAYQEGYWNGVKQYTVNDLATTDHNANSDVANPQSEAQPLNKRSDV